MGNWSELQFQTANRFIHQQVQRYGHHMEQSECVQESWRAFLVDKRNYMCVAGCCSFPAYAAQLILEALDSLRYCRNQQFNLESPCALDVRYIGRVGDCSNSVALWDFAQRQGTIKHRILRQLYNQLEDWEIIEENAMMPETYYALLEELQEAFAEWMTL